ncbi:hypothetical protein [Agrobacterium tumefaciens]|uniref:hypothetical protein n=1 Tax=Agrobacterium tumefaciens TaxID=358 RepID=UPI00220A5CBD|nr:hypothetical protein FY143_27855 [Agrobacterium tumefaciens]
MNQASLQARLLIEIGSAELAFAKLFLPIVAGAALLRPEAAVWIVAYALLTVGVGCLGCFMRAAGKDVLSRH